MSPRRRHSRIAGILILALALGIFERPAWAADRTRVDRQTRRDAPHRPGGFVSKPLLFGLAAFSLVALTKCMPLADKQANPGDWLPDGCTVSFPQYKSGKGGDLGGPWSRGRIMLSVPPLNYHLVKVGQTGVGFGHPADTNFLSNAAAKLGGINWQATGDLFDSWTFQPGKNLVYPKGGCSGAKRSLASSVADLALWITTSSEEQKQAF